MAALPGAVPDDEPLAAGPPTALAPHGSSVGFGDGQPLVETDVVEEDVSPVLSPAHRSPAVAAPMHPSRMPNVVHEQVQPFQEVHASGTPRSGVASPYVPGTPRSMSSSSGPPSSVASVVEDDVTLSKLVEFLALERSLWSHAKTIPLTLLIWITFILVVFHHGQAKNSFESSRSITEAIEAISVPAGDGTGREVRIGTVAELPDVLHWVKEGLVRELTVPGLQHGQLNRVHQQIGFLRVTQTRHVGSDCEMGSDMKSFYSGMCHHTSFAEPPAFGPWKTDFAFRPLANFPQQFAAWLEVGRSLKTVQTRVGVLEELHWIDEHTHDIVVEAAFLNPDQHVYSYLEVHFYVHRGGWIDQHVTVSPILGDIYTHWIHIALDVLWAGLVLVLVGSAATMAHHDHKLGLIKLYFADLYNWLDIFLILFGFCIVFTFWYFSEALASVHHEVAALNDRPEFSAKEVPEYKAIEYTLLNQAYSDKVWAVFGAISRLNNILYYHKMTCMFYSSCIVVRFLRGFSGQPRLSVLIQSIERTLKAFENYVVLFLIIFVTFAISGYILFGEQIQSWSSLTLATSSMIMMLLGRYDLSEIQAIAPINSGIWLFMFITCVQGLMLTMIRACVLDNYQQVKSQLGEKGAGIVEQTTDFLRQLLYSRTYEGSERSMPNNELLEALAQYRSDPERLRQIARLKLDRRLRSQEDVKFLEEDPHIDVNFLIGRGVHPKVAEHLYDRVHAWTHQSEIHHAPEHRLQVAIVRQMCSLCREADRMRARTQMRVDFVERAIDRVGLKHSKSIGLARRIRRAQEIPVGWTLQIKDGQRFLKCEETGLTSWTLPRTVATGTMQGTSYGGM
eukprot:gnl/TRDRNA2_/TRDRNA2_92266_c0_seq1.p1 gnl/TRDRNA2_/TRDRNA2_92266_c0~~gnl/TRDRNA2_/TRDRNA2_92266_c0_seq1.p1  ORF type:complete len:845 (+),score=118.49 gnl/TRDRNA2_/TRDRNA2_92266_c0_seq1:31-2565(+)